MKKLYIVSLGLSLLLTIPSCNYLDVVPDERPTEEDAFQDKYAAERYLYSCYSFMPQERQMGASIRPHGEILSSTDSPATDILLGNISAANPGDYRFWSRMYGAFRRCYTFLENVDNVPHLDEETKRIYKAETNFLLGYYGFYLMKAYGPFIIPEGLYDYNMSPADYPKRAKFDDCVDWIIGRLDEAGAGLLDKQPVNALGRATTVINDALKSRVLLYAASPLFNGNTAFYANALLDPETKEPLMPQTYDANKWKKALEASEMAIKNAEAAGHELYQGEATEEMPFPADPTEYSLRMTFIDRENKEVIWGDSRKEGYYGLQNECTPRDPENEDPSWNNNSPQLEMVEMFYSEKGLPVKEDPTYYPESQWFQLDKYEGETTCKLHLKREPRFYAWISFHNGWYELQRNGESRIRTMYRNEDIHGSGTRTRNYSKSGYLVKKGVGPSFSTRNGYPNYPWPLIRLAELYLNAAEAASEVNDLELGKKYLNKIRERAGIPTVEASWKGVASLTQDKLRQIVHQERNIELFCESHYRWDLNRWLEAEKKMNHNPHGLNINGKTDEDFFTPVEVNVRWGFTSPANYLMPIETSELNMNTKLVQNPGY